MLGIVGGDEACLPVNGLPVGHTHLDEIGDVAAGSAASPQGVAVIKEVLALPLATIEVEGIVHEGKGQVDLRGESENQRDLVDDLGERGAAVTAVAAVAHKLDILDDDTGIGVAAAVRAAAASIQSIVTGGEGEDMELSRYIL